MYRGGDGVRRDAELLIKLLEWRRGAKAVHADEDPVRTQPAVPAKADRSLDADPWCGAQHVGAVAGILLVEQFPARQRDNGNGDAFSGERGSGLHRDGNLRAGGDQGGAARPFGLGQHVATTRAAVFRGIEAHRRQCLPR